MDILSLLDMASPSKMQLSRSIGLKETYLTNGVSLESSLSSESLSSSILILLIATSHPKEDSK
jgi:hypothetical protein